MSDVTDRLIVRGAREHNLRNISLDLPRDALIVFTGLSGSGKSSLAFDTIFAEGQRRYVESLSAYARQFLGQMDKPDVDFIEGLSPAVSIDQKSTSRNPRSTVGTITEVYDYLRLLFARAGRPHCPICGEPISQQSPQQIVDRLMGLPEGTRFQVLAPVVRGRKGEYVDLFRQLAGQGFSRARVDGEVIAAHRAADAGQEAEARHRRHRRPAGDQGDRQAAADRLGRDRAGAGPGRGQPSTSSTSTRAIRDGSGATRRRWPAPTSTTSPSTSSSRGSSPSTARGAPARSAPGWAPGWRSIPSWSCPTTRSACPQGAIAPWASAHVADYFIRLIDALADTVGLQHRRALVPAAGGRQEDPAVRGPRPGARHATATGTAGSAATTPSTRASSPTSSAGTTRPRPTPPGSGSPATCGRCRATSARAPGSSRRRWR